MERTVVEMNAAHLSNLFFFFRCNLCVEKNRLVAERAPSSCSEVSVTSCTDETSFLLDKSPECRKNSYTDDLEKSLSIGEGTVSFGALRSLFFPTVSCGFAHALIRKWEAS